MLKRYHIKNDNKTREGWAIIVIDTEIGYFSTVSDFGNYAYIWSNPGGEFRQFLTELEVDYLRGKLLMGRDAKEYIDVEATKKAIREALQSHANELRESRTFLIVEETKLAEYDFADMSSFDAWTSDTQLVEPYEYLVLAPDPQCTAFCMRVYPRFRKLLKEELAQEAKDQEDAAKLRAAIRDDAFRDVCVDGGCNATHGVSDK